MSRLLAFLRDENGATAIEYGLIAAGIAIVCIAAIGAVGADLSAMFTTIAGAI
jgi:pilus assembly protein Flp/PilA